MKKLFTIAIALLCFNSIQAQYFEHIYGRPFDESLGDGKNTRNTLGHVIVGEGVPLNFFKSNVSVTHTDFNGTVIFNNEYELYNAAGDAITTTTPKVFEFPNPGAAFGVVGKFNDFNPTPPVPTVPPYTGVFYFTLDAAGNPINAYEYRIIPAGGTIWDVYNVTAVTLSATGNEAYITGNAQDTWNNADIFVLKIDINTGALIWSFLYDIINTTAPSFDLAEDIIESPFAPEVVIVGTTYSPGNSQDAFFSKIDANTGAVVAPTQIYGTPSSWDHFTSIDVANQVGGFIIGGYISNTTSPPYDFWLNLVDMNGNPFWAYQYDYSLIPGGDDRCYDVFERFNTNGNYEYYAGGTAFNGIFGTSDALVVKVDNMGNGVGEFSYGDAAFQIAYKIDKMDGTGSDGLSIFGMGDFTAAPAGASELFIEKVYFNGVTSCNNKLSTPTAVPAPSLISTLNMVSTLSFVPGTLSYNNGGIFDKQLCYVWTVGGGSNARTTPNEPQGDKEAIVAPNPMQQGTQAIAVEVKTDAPVTAQVAIYDMLGRCYYNHSFELIKGSNRLPLDISAANMAAGMYTVKITGTHLSNNLLLLVK
ncbi:MAG: T9SS type A sorting domain-containing protein [Bacteroidota bacterium]